MLSSGSIQNFAAAISEYLSMEVADYQRNYSWRSDQIQELLSDVEASAMTGDQHFLGSLILLEEGKERCSIVDGQQRLTTLFLLLARYRDELKKLENTEITPQHSDERDRDVLTAVEDLLYIPKKKTCRFKSNILLRDLFINSMISDAKDRPAVPARDPKSKAVTLPLRRAFRHIEEHVGKELSLRPDPGAKLLYIDNQVMAIANNLQVLKITTSSLEESLDVFLTLNDRGLPLGPSDLVRGQLLQNLAEGEPSSRIPEIHQKVFKEWSTILKRFDTTGIEQSGIDQFFRYYLLATGRRKVVKRSVPREFDNRIRYVSMEEKTEHTPQERKKEAQRIWKEVRTFAEVYADLIDPPADFGDDCVYYLTVLRSVADNYRVLLLNVFLSDANISGEDRTEITRLCYVLTLRWYLNGGGAQELESKFQELGESFRQSPDVETLKTRISTEGRIKFDVAARFKDGQSGFARAILHGIDTAIAKKTLAEPLPWDTSKLHVEHIAPTTSTSHWRMSLLGNSDGDENEYDYFADQLGNKTLLDQKINLSLQQVPFDDKKLLYLEANPRTTRDLATIENWTSDEIELRNDWLAAMFNFIWSDLPDTTSVMQYAIWRKHRDPEAITG